ACGVQVDPDRRSYCLGPIYPARDGWFIYAGHDERGIAIHGVDCYRVPESAALAHFPEARRLLEGRAPPAGTNPQRAEVLDAGYRACLQADPERKDARVLLACVRDAWFDRWRDLDRMRERTPPATMAAVAVAALAQPDGQPWAALVTVADAETRLSVFRTDVV